MARGISRCPNCGEPVSQFAAGCSICGEDLIAARARKAERRASLPGLPARLWDRVPRLDDDMLRFAIALVVVVAAPLFGMLLAAFFAWQVDREGHAGARNALAALAVAGAVLVVVRPYGLVVGY